MGTPLLYAQQIFLRNRTVPPGWDVVVMSLVSVVVELSWGWRWGWVCSGFVLSWCCWRKRFLFVEAVGVGVGAGGKFLSYHQTKLPSFYNTAVRRFVDVCFVSIRWRRSRRLTRRPR